MSNKKQARIQFKGHNRADWPQDYILLQREIGFETDTRFYKIGDGVTPWKDLPYMASGPSAYEAAKGLGFEGTEAEWIASLKGEKGLQGKQGIQGEPGYSPIKGIDYWTDDDKNEVKIESEEIIVEEVAKRNQLMPEFVDSIDKCVDTNKLYVLPDGYIYAYKTEIKTKYPVNQIKFSKNADGTQYLGTNGEKGYKPGYRIRGVGEEQAVSAYGCTGFIECSQNDVIRTKNLTFDLSSTNCNILGYNANREVVTVHSVNSATPIGGIINENGDIEGSLQQTITASTPSGEIVDLANVKYIRFTALKFNITDDENYVDTDPILTINEEIAVSTGEVSEWYNTGIKFIVFDPSDPVVQEILKEEIGSIQIKPEFVNSIEECVDTTKLYVLPDGYIYAYIKKTEMKNPLNQIEYSKNADGSQYYGTNGEKGYKPGYKMSSTSGSEAVLGGYACTGYIQCKATDIIRTKNIEFQEISNSSLTLFDENHAYVGFINGSNANNLLHSIINDNGDIEGSIAQAKSALTEEAKSKIRYIRISALAFSITPDDGNTGNDAILTINEPTESYIVTEQGWFDTGISFVAGKYDDDIVDLKERVSELEAGGVEDVASYVKEEAERVAKLVYSHQNADTFSFMAFSDAHYLPTFPNIVKGNIHLGQGMDLVRKNVNIDFAACLGDSGWGSGVANSDNRATIEMGVEEIRSLNSCIEAAFRGIPNFRSVGNHDSIIYNYTFNNNQYLDNDKLFPLYGAYNRGAIFEEGEKDRGYCYRDFDDWKLRVICMNTSDLKDLTPADNARAICVSATQGEWFARTLDLSSKSDASEWSILILSHTPLDFGAACIYLCDILKAYVDGETCYAVTHDGTTITYDYAGKNAAKIIGNCHGHNHCFKVDYLRRLIGGGVTEPISIKRFCIPNACFERTNERGENDSVDVYDIEYGEEISYEKKAGTAQDTSFCVVTVDPKAQIIYADTYGAGPEQSRIIDYSL